MGVLGQVLLRVRLVEQTQEMVAVEVLETATATTVVLVVRVL